ncbi:murein biosynthesis integral membrane protein MurJ [Alkalibacillus aidingensis]|uniref:murein biosynthesis integral membrane protein MurJ n=1 Tax=Alkalibacillus aidingensis TaxID=2747607 RepID=UPI0016608A97|nr:lipid II flippase MurJ [Alkalibacillus aidingensis]
MSTLKKAAIWTTLLSVLLKLFGFLRESLIAREFGANEYTDGFLLSFTFVTLILAVIANGFNSAFLPHYVKFRQKNYEQAEHDATALLNRVVLFFAGISVVVYFLAPFIVPLFFGDMHPTTEAIAIEITQVFFIFMVIIALSGVLESYLQARRIFVPTQISKIMGTLMSVAFIIFFSDLWGIYSVAYGFLFGTFLGVVIQFYYLVQAKFKWLPSLQMDSEFKKVFFVLLIPALLHSSVGHINVFVNKLFATGTISGAVTYLNNASLLMSIPTTIFTTTVLAIIFTLMSERANDAKMFKETLYSGYQVGIMALVPIAVGTYMLGEQLIAFIYERGEFTPQDTLNTFEALKWYIPIIVTQGLLTVAIKGMYAQGWTKKILKISSVTIVLNLILNYLFVGPFGYPGLALSSSLVSIYYATAATIALYSGYERKEVWRIFALFFKVAVPSLIMAVPIWLLQEFTGVTELYSLVQILLLVPVGVATYIGALYIFYREGFNQMINIIKMK